MEERALSRAGKPDYSHVEVAQKPEASEVAAAPAQPPTPVVRLPNGSVQVTDAEEEVTYPASS